MPTMLFPDPRMRSPTALGDFGLTYACDEVRAAQIELEELLNQAKAARLLTTHWFSADEGHPIAVAAQTVYKQAINENIVITSDEACAEWSAKLRDASTKLRNLLEYNKVEEVQYVPPADTPYREPETPDTLDKLKPLFIAGAVIVGAVLLIPIAFEVAGVSRMLRKSKRRTAGYGRRR